MVKEENKVFTWRWFVRDMAAILSALSFGSLVIGWFSIIKNLPADLERIQGSITEINRVIGNLQETNINQRLELTRQSSEALYIRERITGCCPLGRGR